MGNLGRAGYGASTEGMWPYSYDSCDVGTFVNQTDQNGNPAAAATGGDGGGPLSFLPGQRLSACTCPNSDHPGPWSHGSYTGRGVPEIDILEAQIDTNRFVGEVSQSFQIAPYSYQYSFVNTTPATTIYNDDITHLNTYKGGLFQQAVSAVTDIDSSDYSGNAYAQYGYEWWSDPNHRDQGYITWYSQGDKTWTLTAAAVGPDTTVQVQQRLIPEEPMVSLLTFSMKSILMYPFST
jgi:beta-glucan synthesis-associated protein KRE6